MIRGGQLPPKPPGWGGAGGWGGGGIYLLLHPPPMLALFIGPVSGWNLKQSPFMSAKLSLGEIMATKMNVSDDTIVDIS